MLAARGQKGSGRYELQDARASGQNSISIKWKDRSGAKTGIQGFIGVGHLDNVRDLMSPELLVRYRSIIRGHPKYSSGDLTYEKEMDEFIIDFIRYLKQVKPRVEEMPGIKSGEKNIKSNNKDNGRARGKRLRWRRTNMPSTRITVALELKEELDYDSVGEFGKKLMAFEIDGKQVIKKISKPGKSKSEEFTFETEKGFFDKAPFSGEFLANAKLLGDYLKLECSAWVDKVGPVNSTDDNCYAKK